MNIKLFSSIKHHIFAILLFLAVSVAYFYPQYQGRAVWQYDNIQADGTRASIERNIEEHNQHPQWIDNMFGGMPSYTFDMAYKSKDVYTPLVKTINAIGRPASSYFLLMVGFYFMAICFGISPLVAIVGGLAWGLSSYFYIIYTAGHVMKLVALIYVAPLIGSIYYAYNKNLLVGGSLAALFTALEIKSVHPQVTYYFLFIILALIISVGVGAYYKKELRKFFITSGVLFGFALLGVGANLVYLYYTMDYTHESTRGKAILVTADTIGNKGVDKDYITAWSYGKMETFNLLIPNLYGGSSEGGFTNDGEVYKSLKGYKAESATESIPAYWGPQPSTSGPVYIGAVIIFLFVLSLFLVRGALFWSMIGITALAILLAWGKNFMWLTDLFIDYFPLYSKFRTVSMILLIVEFTVPFLAMFGVEKIIKNENELKVLKALLWSSIVVGGVIVIFLLFGEQLLSFTSESDLRYGLPEDVLAAMQLDRINLLQLDAMRSLMFVGLSAAVVMLIIKNKKYSKIGVIALALLVVLDLFSVNRRYLGNKNFIDAKAAKEIPMTAIDKAIAKDTTNYRVANFSGNIFNESTTSKYHRSVGGYSAVKPRRYQDLIDNYLSKQDMKIYSLLNTKYIINKDKNGKLGIYVNPDALGNAWFVNSIVWCDTPNIEMEMLGKVDLEKEAVVNVEFKEKLEKRFTHPTQQDTIYQTEYRPNLWRFNYKTGGDRLVVLSEVYYPSGWSAKIGERELELVRVNYNFFGVIVPEGEGEIVFEFKVPNLGIVDTITFICSVAILLILIISIYLNFRKGARNEREE